MSHTCHSMRCNRRVPPKMFMCRDHWYELPKHDRDLIWRLYRPGQETDKNPSSEYMAAATRIIREQDARLNP